VSVERVVRVISMRPVTRVPGAHPGLAGAIQDHGRVIGLLAHPLARGGVNAPAARTIVCRTDRGLLGLPVSEIHDQQAFAAHGQPDHGQVIEHDAHAYTFIDPEALGVVCRAGAAQST
jgi:chemotaxis signal transduction protein